MSLIDRGREYLQHRFEEKEPELAQAARTQVRKITGLDGNQDVAVGYAEWKTDDPFVINPRHHFQLRSVAVFPPGEGPANVSYSGTETHRRGGNLSAYGYTDSVTYPVRAYAVSPERPLFNREIIRHYLVQIGLESAVGYAMRYLGEQQRQYQQASRTQPRRIG